MNQPTPNQYPGSYYPGYTAVPQPYPQPPYPQQPYSQQPYPQQPYPYPLQSYVPPRPAPERAAPTGRLVPLIWAGALIVLTVAAVGLAALAPVLRTSLPATAGQVIYQNTLTTDDGHWTLQSNDSGQCSYAAGGLFATSASSGNIVPSCVFKQPLPNVRFTVNILPQVHADTPLRPVIVASGVAFVFDSSGIFLIYTGDSQRPVSEGTSVEWHTANKSNAITLDVNGSTYTLAINGSQIYQGQPGGDGSGTIQLGAHSVNLLSSESSDTGEAAFADAVISTP